MSITSSKIGSKKSSPSHHLNLIGQNVNGRPELTTTPKLCCSTFFVMPSSCRVPVLQVGYTTSQPAQPSVTLDQSPMNDWKKKNAMLHVFSLLDLDQGAVNIIICPMSVGITLLVPAQCPNRKPVQEHFLFVLLKIFGRKSHHSRSTSFLESSNHSLSLLGRISVFWKDFSMQKFQVDAGKTKELVYMIKELMIYTSTLVHVTIQNCGMK